MATANASLIFDSTTDANFRAWGSGISALLPTGSFWTQASDTGQINWTTVTSPAASTFAGYEIWKSNDALSSSFTIYMKIEYGNNGASTKGPSLRFSFATGSNGAGTLTGSILGTFTTHGNVSGTGATLYNMYCSGGTGYFTMMFWILNGEATTIPAVFGIERSQDSSGNYTSTYAQLYLWGNNATCNQQVLFKIGSGTVSTLLAQACSTFVAGATAAFGSFAAPFPLFPFIGYADNPGTFIMGMKTGDQVEGATFTVVTYGTTHTYLYSKTFITPLGSSWASMGVGIRYE